MVSKFITLKRARASAAVDSRWWSDGEKLAGLAKEASRYFRVIMPDSRGHGLTNNPQGTFSYDLMTEDMAAFVKALKLEKPLVMGYSDGGMVVLKLTSRYRI